MSKPHRFDLGRRYIDLTEYEYRGIIAAYLSSPATELALAEALGLVGVGHYRGWDGCNASSHMGLGENTGTIADHFPDADAILQAWREGL